MRIFTLIVIGLLGEGDRVLFMNRRCEQALEVLQKVRKEQVGLGLGFGGGARLFLVMTLAELGELDAAKYKARRQ